LGADLSVLIRCSANQTQNVCSSPNDILATDLLKEGLDSIALFGQYFLDLIHGLHDPQSFRP
jgi:hypothetical protein